MFLGETKDSTTATQKTLRSDRVLRAKRVELVVRCRELARYLRGFEEHTWADWIDRRVEEIRADDPDSTRHLREGYEGLANISDLFLCCEAGHRVAPADENSINEQLLLMISKVRTLVDQYETLRQRIRPSRA